MKTYENNENLCDDGLDYAWPFHIKPRESQKTLHRKRVMPAFIIYTYIMYIYIHISDMQPPNVDTKHASNVCVYV